jgi:hypothetical protein
MMKWRKSCFSRQKKKKEKRKGFELVFLLWKKILFTEAM